MKQIVIHRHRGNNQVYRVYILSEEFKSKHSKEEIEKRLQECNTDTQITSIHEVDDNISDAIQFLIDDRKMDKFGIIEELSDLANTIDNIQDSISEIKQEIENRLNKED